MIYRTTIPLRDVKYFSIVCEKGDDNGENVTWERDEWGHCACNGNGILNERFQLHEYMYSPATSSEVLLLLEERVFMSGRNISFPRGRSAEGAMLVGRWEISFGRSDQTEVERTRLDFRTDTVTEMVERSASSRRYYRPVPHMIHRTHICAPGRGEISRRKHKVIRIGYRFCSYIRGQK